MTPEQMKAVFREYKAMSDYIFSQPEENKPYAVVVGIETQNYPIKVPVNSVIHDINDFIHITAVGSMATQATLRNYNDYDEIQDNENDIVHAIDNLLANESITTDVRMQLRQLKAATVEALVEKKTNFDGNTIVTANTTTALNLTQHITGSVYAVDSITSRNKIVNPLFVSGGTTIKSRSL